MRVNCKCLLCKKEMKAGEKSSFLSQVELTDQPLRKRYGGVKGEIPEGKLRIMRLNNNPRGLICLRCLDVIFRDFDINEDFMNEIGYTPQ